MLEYQGAYPFKVGLKPELSALQAGSAAAIANFRFAEAARGFSNVIEHLLPRLPFETLFPRWSTDHGALDDVEMEDITGTSPGFKDCIALERRTKTWSQYDQECMPALSVPYTFNREPHGGCISQ